MKTIVSVTPDSVDTDSRSYKIAASFARFGYRSIVVEGRPSGVTPQDLPFELRTVGKELRRKETQIAGGNTLQNLLPEVLVRPARAARALIRYGRDYGAWVARALPPASLYYLHAPYQFPGVYPAARRCRAPIIYDAHDFYTLDDRTPFLGWIESWCIRYSKSVVTVAPGVAELFSKRYGRCSTVLRNVHDRRLDKAPAKGLRDHLGLGPEQFLLVCVGQTKSGQHVEGALTAMASLPPFVHLAFLGHCSNLYREQALKLGISNRVHTIPPVKPEEVVPFIRSADASLILYVPLSLNYEYCLPNKLFQSIAASLPLLYPNLTEIKAVVERYKLGISIDPFSSDSIKTAVFALLENPSRQKAFRTAAGAAASDLSWENEEEILRELILKTLSSGE